MKSQYTVGEYSAEKAEDLETLWMDQYDGIYAKQRARLFRWLTEENPFNDGKCPYYLLFHGEEVIGMLGHMPLEFNVNGRAKTGRISQDALLAKAYRGRGLGGMLLNGVTSMCLEFTGALWFNEPNYKLYIRNAWLDVPEFYSFVKIFDPLPFLRKKVRVKIVARILSRFLVYFVRGLELRSTRTRTGNLQIREVGSFDSGVDDFFHRISSNFGIIVSRTKAYLDWKFQRKPFNNYRRYTAYKNGTEFAGYIVTKSEAWEDGIRGRILDLLVDPGEVGVLKALVRRALVDLASEKVSYVDAIFSFAPFCKELRKLGFIRSRKPLRFMVKNWERDFSREFIGDINNWYLTASDADGDAWSVDLKDESNS